MLDKLEKFCYYDGEQGCAMQAPEGRTEAAA